MDSPNAFFQEGFEALFLKNCQQYIIGGAGLLVIYFIIKLFEKWYKNS